MKTDTFNLRRFGRLVRHDLQLCDPRYSVQGASMVSAILFPVLMVVMQTLLGNADNAGEPLYRLLLAVGFPVFWALILPANIFFRTDKKDRGMYFALLPASKCEKYWSMFVVSLVIVPAVLIVGSLALDTLVALFRIGPWQQFAWQIGDLAHPFPRWFAPVALTLAAQAMAVSIWVSTFRSRPLAAIAFVVFCLWVGVSVVSMVAVWDEPSASQWILPVIFALQLALAALMVFVGRRRLDRMQY
ncbi:MAG: hypothetical protein J6I49_04780 [Bacteroidales bacterium]|nr:hypothetical protein [Bacteroidales bacterium]